MPLQFHLSAGARETGLELGYFGEVEVAHFHSGHNHLESLFTRGADCGTEKFDVLEHFDEGLIETEVADGASNLTVFDKKQAITGHAGHDFFVRVNFADVPEAGDEEAAISGSDH